VCGICGVVGLDSPGAREPRERRAAASLHRLRHRGPDETLLAACGGGAIGATRLAIRGLASGSQPIVDNASGVVVACNGEIDNHKELRAWLTGRGHVIPLETDIAVIPGLYLEHGESFAEHLVGAFAVAVWDPRVPCVILARDPATLTEAQVRDYFLFVKLKKHWQPKSIRQARAAGRLFFVDLLGHTD